MNTKLAHFLSVILHPLWMPTLLFILLFYLAPTTIGADFYDAKTRILLLVFIFFYTFILPSASIYWLYRIGIIKSIKMETLPDRKIPYLLTAAIYGSLSYFFYSKNALFQPLAYLMLSSTLLLFCVAIVSFWWQISAHAAGIGSMIGVLLIAKFRFDEGALFYPLLLLILLAGALISARLYLNAHSSAQVFAGFFLGFFISIMSLYFFL